ncbi:MAG: NAD(P)-binding domain-containing protein [Negativicutes bacterium]|nr:NAD(P)-binding domain-containing protein [Negativicutes bacterium]
MRIGLVGVGRMGMVLAARLREYADVLIFDRDPDRLALVAEELNLPVAAGLDELADAGVVILAVPDREVISLIKDFNLIKKPLSVFNVATNVAQMVLEEAAAKHVRCTGVKLIGHANEIALGQRPVIIINDKPAELVPVAEELFAPLGDIIIGKADSVTAINTIAAQKALEAAVAIEETLIGGGVTDSNVIKSAIRQVAAGILKAYTNDDLGPFAREIVRAVRAKLKK